MGCRHRIGDNPGLDKSGPFSMAIGKRLFDMVAAERMGNGSFTDGCLGADAGRAVDDRASLGLEHRPSSARQLPGIRLRGRKRAVTSPPSDAVQIHPGEIRVRFWLCRWPWSGWLVPVERSGHTTRRSHTIFLAPDDADQAEGIAGQTWAQNRVVVVNGLSDVNENPSREVLAEYAQRTWIAETWVLQKQRQHARSFCGIPVEVKGKLWGVIVLDSRNPQAIDQNADKFYRLIGRVLGKLLERA